MAILGFFRKLPARLLADESGQATTEYILLISMMLGMVVMLGKKLIQPAYERMKTRLMAQIDSRLFPRGEALHQLRIPH